MKFLKITALIIVFVILFISFHLYSNSPVTTEEVFRKDEAEQIQRSVESFLKVVEENKTDYVARGAHAKGHACVKAYFDVNESLQPKLQHGVFNTPGKRYKSWIRFSNGRSSMKSPHDADKDAHGMAIKLINIYDDNLIKAEEGSETQDFLMHDSPVFFAANIEDYNRFVESKNKILYFFSGLNPFKWNLRELQHGLATLKEPPISPLWSNYFSNTAYKLGPHNIKFSTKSCSINKGAGEQDKTDSNFLRLTIAKELKTAEACFDFMVQLQNPGKYMPIEDPSIEWKESDSPFISIAKITIPAQGFDTEEQQKFCENLSYSPWHSLNEHRPIGELNRIRKAVYKASSEYRHTNNNTDIPINLDW
jgi:catalase